MLKLQENINQSTDFSKTTENKSFFLQLNVQNHFELSNNEKQKIFEVFHKNEIIYLNKKKEGKNNQKNCSCINHKCLYCKKKFRNIYQFEIHMKIHVSYNSIIL